MQKKLIKFLEFLYEHNQNEVFFSEIKKNLFQTKSTTSSKLTIFRMLDKCLSQNLITPASFKLIIENEQPINLTFKGKYFLEAVKEKQADKRGLGSLMKDRITPKWRKEEQNSNQN